MKTLAKYRQVIALLGTIGIASCKPNSDEIPVRNAILKPGETVEANNSNGKVRIAYVAATKRRYEWNEKSRVVTLIPREEIFDGKLGLYEPANAWALPFSKDRLVVQESIINFENLSEIEAFLVQSKDYMDWVYNDDGLVVGFGRTPARRQIDIDLWQLLLHGKKPTGLSGARPDRIQLIRKED